MNTYFVESHPKVLKFGFPVSPLQPQLQAEDIASNVCLCWEEVMRMDFYRWEQHVVARKPW